MFDIPSEHHEKLHITLDYAKDRIEIATTRLSA